MNRGYCPLPVDWPNSHYVLRGERHVDELDGGDGASKGELGERAAYQAADDRDLEVAEGITKDSANQQGIDLIAVDDEGNYVLIEAMFTSRSGNVGIGDLSRTSSGRQMSDEWIISAIRRMDDAGTIDADLRKDLLESFPGNTRKEMVVVKNTGRTGNRSRIVSLILDSGSTGRPSSKLEK